MRVITGGAGFIGSAICWKLNQLGRDDILIVDIDRNGTKSNNLENLSFGEFIEKDEFLDFLNSDELSKKIETIYHMGACSSTTESDMNYLKANNVDYSISLAKWAAANNARFIYASSAATYGAGEFGFSDDIFLIPELKPLNKYGLSKQMFDMWVIENNLLNKFVGLKYFNVFGPNENHKGEMRSVVNKSYEQIKKTGKMGLFKSYNPEYKNGGQKRDFIYIKDAVEMTTFFDTFNPGFNQSGIFNIGSGKAITWNDLAKAIFKAMSLEPCIEYIEMPENLKEQYQYFSEADITKLRKAGYKNKIISIEESVCDYVKNYLAAGKYL